MVMDTAGIVLNLSGALVNRQVRAPAIPVYDSPDRLSGQSLAAESLVKVSLVLPSVAD
jgi:hypothetical protein